MILCCSVGSALAEVSERRNGELAAEDRVVEGHRLARVVPEAQVRVQPNAHVTSSLLSSNDKSLHWGSRENGRIFVPGRGVVGSTVRLKVSRHATRKGWPEGCEPDPDRCGAPSTGALQQCLAQCARPTGEVMVSSFEVPRNAERTQGEGRTKEAPQRGQEL